MPSSIEQGKIPTFYAKESLLLVLFNMSTLDMLRFHALYVGYTYFPYKIFVICNTCKFDNFNRTEVNINGICIPKLKKVVSQYCDMCLLLCVCCFVFTLWPSYRAGGDNSKFPTFSSPMFFANELFDICMQ